MSHNGRQQCTTARAAQHSTAQQRCKNAREEDYKTMLPARKAWPHFADADGDDGLAASVRPKAAISIISL